MAVQPGSRHTAARAETAVRFMKLDGKKAAENQFWMSSGRRTPRNMIFCGNAAAALGTSDNLTHRTVQPPPIPSPIRSFTPPEGSIILTSRPSPDYWRLSRERSRRSRHVLRSASSLPSSAPLRDPGSLPAGISRRSLPGPSACSRPHPRGHDRQGSPQAPPS